MDLFHNFSMNIRFILSYIQSFSRANLWIYLVFLLWITVIGFSDKGNIFAISIIFISHCAADIAMMMMGDLDGRGKHRDARIAQGVSFLIFTAIGIAAIITKGEWQYMLPQILYGMSAVYAYQRDRSKIEITPLRWGIFLGATMLIIGCMWYYQTFTSIASFLQAVGFLMMPVVLLFENAKERIFGLITTLGCLILGSFLACLHSWVLGDISGYQISYFLLPLTVFIFFLRNFRLLINK